MRAHSDTDERLISMDYWQKSEISMTYTAHVMTTAVYDHAERHGCDPSWRIKNKQNNNNVKKCFI